MTAATPAHTYATFQDAYLAHLRKIRDEPEFRNAPRGFRSREILGVSYRLADPRERVVRVPGRRTNIVFNFAEALWYLSASDSLEFMSFYAPSIDKYSADGRTLRGTAYGPRIFNFGGAGFNQWDSVVNTLRADPDSKRALIQIFAPEELLVTDNPDVACTIGLQFVIREGRLHAVAFMRANDAYRGTASDVFSFTLLQEVLAHQLGLELGTYTHVAGSYHLYESDSAFADRVLADEGSAVHTDPFPAMPAGDNWPAIRRVVELERQVRAGAVRLGRRDVEQSGLPRYWAQVLALLCLHARRKHERTVDPDLMDMLDPLYAGLVGNCWRDRVAAAL
ncbi:thymidylate synthase [Saccharothrix yanglingensis]|uniref:Thymidylate synthase n=1 Tax=Saccharothrix yanglingensis TaxID=659496 RepID=A0ABU0X3H6_9PSEU|nr:thymidylate synthase [Saccharothrix yanglingensis]MDQ2586673.1 thymidylate synthase [Saccharothrix yanglingensis]